MCVVSRGCRAWRGVVSAWVAYSVGRGFAKAVGVQPVKVVWFWKGAEAGCCWDSILGGWSESCVRVLGQLG